MMTIPVKGHFETNVYFDNIIGNGYYGSLAKKCLNLCPLCSVQKYIQYISLQFLSNKVIHLVPSLSL